MTVLAAEARRRESSSAPSSRRRVLCFVDSARTFEQQQIISEALEATGRWEAWFMAMPGADVSGLLAKIGVRVWPPPGEGGHLGIVPAAASAQSRSGLRLWIGRVLQSRAMTPAREILLSLLLARTWRKARRRARVSLAASRAACIITAQERDDAALPIVAAARDVAIPVILVPAAGLFMPDGGAYMRRHSPELMLDRAGAGGRGDGGQLLINRIVGLLQPGHVFPSRWGRMLHRRGHWYIGAWLAGLSLRSGWFQGTRFANAVVISGDDERRVCRAAGIEPERVSAIGSPILQRLHQRFAQRSAIRAALDTRYRLSRDKPLLVLAIPHLWEHKMIGRDAHFEFVRDLLANLSSPDWALLISLHPSSRRDDYEPFCDASRAVIAEEPLSNFLVAADAFVAGAYSSTIRWALGVGVPAMNIDMWDLNESTYAGQADYPTARSLAQLTDWLASVRMQLERGERHPRSTPPVGLICDGKFDRHIVTLVEKLASEGDA